MTNGDPLPSARRICRICRGLRSPGIALLQRLNVPLAPRSKDPAGDDQPEDAATNAGQAAFQALKQFSPGDYVKWFCAYLKYRFGRRFPFATYAGKQPHDGIYPLEGDGGHDPHRHRGRLGHGHG